MASPPLTTDFFAAPAPGPITRPLSSNCNAPPLPVELISEILREVWLADISRLERIALCTSLTLVNHTWLAAFLRIALRDVHILTPNHAKHFLRFVRPQSSFDEPLSPLARVASKLTNALCTTLTFHVAHAAAPGAAPAIKLYSEGHRGAEAVSATLYTLSLVPAFVPRLRRVCVHYADWGFADVTDAARLMPMPPQVRALAIRYDFSPVLQRAADGVRRSFDAGVPASVLMWDMSHVRTLELRGAPSRLVSRMAQMCDGVQTLIVDEHVELAERWTVPQGVRTLVLQKFDAPNDEVALDWWRLARTIQGDVALTCEEGLHLSLDATWRRRLGRDRLKRMCARQKVQIVYV